MQSRERESVCFSERAGWALRSGLLAAQWLPVRCGTVAGMHTLVREYVFIVFTFHLVLVCFLFSFFSHFHEDITNLTEITCARRVAAGPGRVRVKIVISVTVTDSVYTGPSRLGVLSWAGRLRGAPLAVFADASV